MDREKLFEIIVSILVQIQEMSGREIPKITPKTVPLMDLPGFDSLTGLEFTTMLPSEIWGSEQNLCISEEGTTALCIEEIVSRIMGHCNTSS